MDILKADIKLNVTSDLRLKRGVLLGFTADWEGTPQGLVHLHGAEEASAAYIYFNCQHWIYNRHIPETVASTGGPLAFCPGDEVVVFVHGAVLIILGIYDKDGRDTLLHSPCWPVFPPEMSFIVIPISRDDFNMTWSQPFFNDPPADPYDFVDKYFDIYGHDRSAGTLVTLQDSAKKHGRLITMHAHDQFVAHTLAEFFAVESEFLYLLPSTAPEVSVAGRSIGYTYVQNAFLLGGIPFGINLTRYNNAYYEAHAIAASPNDEGELVLRIYNKVMIGTASTRTLQLGIMNTVVMPFPCVRGIINFGPVYPADVVQHFYGALTPYDSVNYAGIDADYMTALYEVGLNMSSSNSIKVYALNGGHFTYSWGWRVQPDDPHLYVYNIETPANEDGELRPVVTMSRLDNVFSKAQPSTAFNGHVGNGHSPIVIGGGNVFTGKQVVTSDTGGNDGTNDGYIVYCHNGIEISRFRHRATIAIVGDNWTETVHESAVTHFHYIRPDLGFYLFTELQLTNSGYSSSMYLEPMQYLVTYTPPEMDAEIAAFNAAISDDITAKFYSWNNGVKTLHSTTVIPYTKRGARAMATQDKRFRSYPAKVSTHQTEKSLDTPVSTGTLTSFTFSAWNWVDNAAVDHLQPIYNLDECLGLPGAGFLAYWYLHSALTENIVGSQDTVDHYSGVSVDGENAVYDGYTMFNEGASTCYTPIYAPFKTNMAPAVSTIAKQHALIAFRDPFDAAASYELFTGPAKILQRLKEAINPEHPEQVTFTKTI